MSDPIERLLEAFHRLPDSDNSDFLERLESESWYRAMVRTMQGQWENPRDNSYKNLWVR